MDDQDTLPAAHVEQTSCPLFCCVWPDGQLLQVLAGAVAIWPLSHTAHVVAPSILEYWPLGQPAQVNADAP